MSTVAATATQPKRTLRLPRKALLPLALVAVVLGL